MAALLGRNENAFALAYVLHKVLYETRGISVIIKFELVRSRCRGAIIKLSKELFFEDNEGSF